LSTGLVFVCLHIQMSRNTRGQIKYILSITVFTTVMLFNVSAFGNGYFRTDTLKTLNDTLKIKADSLSHSADSLNTIQDSTLSKREVRYRERKREKEIRDSIRAVNDSIRWSKPRIMDTYIVPDSMQYKRLIVWNHNNFLNKIAFKNPDTTFKQNF